ncbi:hypothetical protein AB0J38_14565 [Streptomyces sp. NPDC050095]|uniref:hypothetical protein n=1 Tax=unclassified Streptomyces TaxID=2593676 RepID=UPI0034325ECB
MNYAANTHRKYNDALDSLHEIKHDELNHAWTQMTLAMACEADAKKRRTYQIAARALAVATLSERHRDVLIAEITAEMAALDASRAELDHPWPAPTVREMRYAD